MFYARARINTIKLEDHKGRGIEGYDKTCKLCKEEKEDLFHFIVKCRKLEEIRDYRLLDKNISNPEERMRKLLFRDNRCHEIGKMVKDLWIQRRKILNKLTNRQLNSIPHRVNDPEMSTQSKSKSDPGPMVWGYRDIRQRYRSLSKG